ncbi:hypothetical protein Henu6_gp112 [Acinetobacter phage Henu6]|jgi:hypothetical protein|nr:hypothetical protein Henu6_gp112 [Acinetobacter phage Henu6]
MKIVITEENNMRLGIFKFIRKLREQGKSIRLDRERIKAHIRAQYVLITDAEYKITRALEENYTHLARTQSHIVDRAQIRIESLEKIDYNLAQKQRAVGKAIQQAISLNDRAHALGKSITDIKLRLIKEDFIENILHVPYYNLRHGEHPYGW